MFVYWYTKKKSLHLQHVSSMSNPPLICGVRVKWVYFQSKVELAVVWLQAGEDAQLDKTERGEEKRLKAVFLFLEKKKLVTS